MNALTISIVFLLIMTIFLLPTNYILRILLLSICFIPSDQSLQIVGVDFQAVRILGMAAVVRIYSSSSSFHVNLQKVDHVFILYILIGTLSYIITWGTVGAAISRLGFALDALLIYFLARALCRTEKDLQLIIKALLVYMIFLVPFVVYEHFYSVNPFHLLGQDKISIREGRVRCRAAFRHAILLGSFSASIVPLAFGYYSISKRIADRRLGMLSGTAAVYITFATASSGPIIGLFGAIVCLLLYRVRRHLPIALFVLTGVAVLLHLVMKAPVWHLIGRIDLAGGSTGYHRVALITKTVDNFSEWALFGVKGIEHWGIHAGDVTSMYIAQGVLGGAAALLLFCWILWSTSKQFWMASRIRGRVGGSYLYWALFSSMFSHLVSFISVAYFGQILFYFYILLAVSVCSTRWIKRENIKRSVAQVMGSGN